MSDSALISTVLIESCQNGDPHAPQEILTALEPLIRSIARSCASRPPSPAFDDLQQQASQIVLEIAHDRTAIPADAFLTHLTTSLRWRLRNYVRAERRRLNHQTPLDNLAAIEHSIIRQHQPNVPNPQPGPAVARALARLSPRQRAVITGLYFREQTVGEVADALQVGRPAVAALRRRAETRLRLLLAEPPKPSD